MSMPGKKSNSPKRREAHELQVLTSRVPLAGDGDGFFPAEAWGHIARKLGLSPRQTQIARCVVAGQADKEIARRLGLSPRTVHTHLERLRAKLGVENRVDLVARVFAAHNNHQSKSQSDPPAGCP